MKNNWFRLLIILLGLINISSNSFAQTADYSEVGKRVAIMLQNRHFSHIPFDSKISKQFLNDYLVNIDDKHLYFTQRDVEEFNVKYGDNLHTLIFKGEAMKVAQEIYQVFKDRASVKIGTVNSLLDSEEFCSKDDDRISKTRYKEWAINDVESQIAWELYIKKLFVDECLKNKGSNKVGELDRSIKSKILGQLQANLARIMNMDEREIADIFLSSVAKVYDPHSDFLTSKEMTAFKDTMKNQLVGIGTLLKSNDDGSIEVTGIVVGGPTDRDNRIHLDDKILAVDPINSGDPLNMKDVQFMQTENVIDLIRGAENTSVALKIETKDACGNAESKVIVIPRGKVPIKDEEARGELVQVKMEQGANYRLGIIILPSFYSDFEEGQIRCSVDVEHILLKLIDEKIDGLILDIRNNGGGVLEEVRRMTGFFIDSGPVVQVKDSLGRIQVKETDNTSPLYTGPMVVLINRNSASASEIIAGALQDYNRAVIVGDISTFGKGTVQQPMDIGRELPLFAARENAGSLKITIQKFYRPTGSSTQIEGVHSDVVLPSLTDGLHIGEQYLNHALPHDRIRPANNFKPQDGQLLFINDLRKLSSERVSSSKDFEYIIGDLIKMKEEVNPKATSLNILNLQKELHNDHLIQERRRIERVQRFTKVSEEDKIRFTFSKISVDAVSKGEGFQVYDPSAENEEYIRRSKNPLSGLNVEPNWPNNLDPQKRESLYILKDLVDFTEQSKIVDLIKR